MNGILDSETLVRLYFMSDAEEKRTPIPPTFETLEQPCLFTSGCHMIYRSSAILRPREIIHAWLY